MVCMYAGHLCHLNIVEHGFLYSSFLSILLRQDANVITEIDIDG